MPFAVNVTVALSKAMLFDMSKRLNDGFYIVSETELGGKGLTRFGFKFFDINIYFFIRYGFIRG